jgi:pilus assembly protein CpaE
MNLSSNEVTLLHPSTIAVVSPLSTQLLDLGQRLKRIPNIGSVITIHSDLQNLPDLQDPPDVVIAADPFEEYQSMDALARFGLRYPRTRLVVCSRQNSADFLMHAMRSGVREVIPPEASDEFLLEAMRRIQSQQHPALEKEGTVLSFISCKGGGGATFLATNLAYALASEHNKRLAVIDLNLQYGDAALFVSDQKPATHLGELSQKMRHLDASLLSAAMLPVLPNYGLLASPETPALGSDIQAGQIASIIRLARSQYDYVILDIGRGLDQVGFTALELSDQIYPILQNTIPYIRDGKRLLGLMQSMGYEDEKIFPVVNRHDRESEITIKQLETALAKKIARTIPNHYSAVAASVNQGVPVVKLAKASPVAKSLLNWASKLSGKYEHTPRGWIARVLH